VHAAGVKRFGFGGIGRFVRRPGTTGGEQSGADGHCDQNEDVMIFDFEFMAIERSKMGDGGLTRGKASERKSGFALARQRLGVRQPSAAFDVAWCSKRQKAAQSKTSRDKERLIGLEPIRDFRCCSLHCELVIHLFRRQQRRIGRRHAGDEQRQFRKREFALRARLDFRQPEFQQHALGINQIEEFSFAGEIRRRAISSDRCALGINSRAAGQDCG